MITEYARVDLGALAARWWTLVVRGIAAILFGILAFVAPGASLLALVFLFGAYALVDGVFTIVLAARSAREGQSWGWLLFEGIVGIAAGLATFSMPGMTAFFLLVMIAGWAILKGIAEIAAAIRLRKVIDNEWLLATGGVLSALFGVLLLASPAAGALTLIWIIAAYAIVFGVVMIGLGARLNRIGRQFRELPPGGTLA